MGGKFTKQHIQYSMAINHPSSESESAIYKSPAVFPQDQPYQSSIFDSFLESVEKFHDLPLFGTRMSAGGKMKEYRWRTYHQIYREAVLVGKGINSLELPSNEDGLCVFGLFSKNREEWAIFDLACITQNVTSVGIYDSIKVDELKFIINETQKLIVSYII